MPIYSYKAVDGYGNVVRGTLPAQSEMELESKLKQSNLDLVTVSEAGALTLLGYKVTLREMVLLCNHFYQLEKAGVPILEAVSELRDISTSKTISQIMMDVYDALKNGKSFSSALSGHPRIFDTVFIGLIKAGEKTGTFVEVFKHLEMHYRWVLDIRKKVRKAVAYPITVLIVMTFVVSILMIFVVPKIAGFLASQKIALPFYTVALIEISKFFSDYWEFIFLTPFLLYITAKILAKFSDYVRFTIDNLKLKIPYIGDVIRKIEIARFCHFFAITYKGGISILDCLETSSAVVDNMVIRDAILNVRADVMDGKKLTEAIKSSKQFTPLVVRMFRVGEESGNLDQSIMNITEFYDEEVDEAVNGLVEFLEPILTVVMGGLLLWITLAVFGPIYSNLGSLGR